MKQEKLASVVTVRGPLIEIARDGADLRESRFAGKAGLMVDSALA